jgi:hypothetical protein
MLLASFLSFYGSYSAKIACIWLSVWAIRWKAEADYPLDRFARIVRWTVVALGFAIGYYVPGPGLGYVRVAGGFLGLAFLCWPNFAYHLTNVFRGKPSQGRA